MRMLQNRIFFNKLCYQTSYRIIKYFQVSVDPVGVTGADWNGAHELPLLAADAGDKQTGLHCQSPSEGIKDGTAFPWYMHSHSNETLPHCKAQFLGH